MKPRTGNVLSNVLEDVRNVYRDLDQRPVDRDCIHRTECCQFQITGKIPHLTKGEALLAAHALRATGRTTLPKRNDGACPLLKTDGKCMIYAHRPFGCRTHFCPAAGGPYSRREVLDLIRRLEDIDAKLGGDGAHLLTVALQQELEHLQ